MHRPEIAYFSMEVGLESTIPTYAGGLGVLAGDTLRAAADLGIPMVGVSLVHRLGYLRQHLEPDGTQREGPDPWDPQSLLEDAGVRMSVTIENRRVSLRAWRYTINGAAGAVPVYLLDSFVPENTPDQRRMTNLLYGGDLRYRLCQEIILGIGGVALLDALGHRDIRTYHINEGHAALLSLALLERESGDDDAAVAAVRRRCVFTTHTPVPAGHDQFGKALARLVLGERRTDRLDRLGCCHRDVLNMTHLGLFFAGHINGVAMRHGQISRTMFPGYPISSITNGVHATTWTAPAFRALFDQHIPDWRQQNDNLRYAIGIPEAEIREAHLRCKTELLAEVESRTQVRLSPGVLTLGFARRATAFKRANLLLADADRLAAIARKTPLQIIYAGKAHPRDDGGKVLIKHLFELAAHLRGAVPIVYLEQHDMDLGRLMCAGSDLWVNTPQKPEEASGTSGMKAALNGVPSLSVLDGWWIEGHVEGVTGWSIGETWEPEPPNREVSSMYRKLEAIADLYYGAPDRYARVGRSAIAINGSFFNTQRMLEQYWRGAYHRNLE